MQIADVAANPVQASAATNIQSRLIELDFARGVAILLALGWHFNVHTGYTVLDWLQAPGRTIGWAGVDLFFVLSGYLVGGLIFSEIKRTGEFAAARFLVRRAFKIWPILYLYIAVLVATGRYHPMEIVPQTILHLQNYWLTPLNHLWSLAVEEHFYLIFAALASVFSLGTNQVKHVPKILAGVMVTALVLRIASSAAGIEPHTLQVQTQFRIDSLACGVLLAYTKCFAPDTFASLLRRKALWWGIAVAGVAFLVFAGPHKALISTIGYSIAYVAGAAFLLLILDGRTVTARSRLTSCIAWIGTYSYAMYVFQFVMFRGLEKLWAAAGLGIAPPVIELAMKYGGAMLLAAIVTKAVERPSLRLRDRFFPAQKSAANITRAAIDRPAKF